MWGVKGKENCECEGVWGEKCGVLGEGEVRMWGCRGGKGRCVWEGRGSVEAQDSSERKMSLGVWGGAWRGVCVGWVVHVCEHKVNVRV